MTTFHVADMNCGACAGRIQRSVVDMDEKARIEVNIPERTVQITGSASDADYAEAIQDAGYTPTWVEVPSTGGAAAQCCQGSAAASGGGCCG
jgi:copper chaperone CopZ